MLFIERNLCHLFGVFHSFPRHPGEDLSVLKTGPEAMTLGSSQAHLSGEAKDSMNHLDLIDL